MSEGNGQWTGTDGLLDAVRAGDQEAFERLFGRHREFLKRFVDLRLDGKLRRRADPSDVVQETLMVAFQRLDDYLSRQPMPFRLWLREAARERLINLRQRHLGAAKRAADREALLPDRSSAALARTLIADGWSPSEEAVRHEREQAVLDAIAKLQETDRQILFMRTTEGLSYKEIGYLLDISPAAARKRFGRALARLQARLAEAGMGGSHS